MGDYTTACFLDFPYFKDTYKTIAVYLSKQQKLDVKPKPNQEIILQISIEQAVQEPISFLKKQEKLY